MCSKCNLFTQEEIKVANMRKRDEYLKILLEYQNFNESVTRQYIPSCKYGYTDCICDNEYIKASNPKWYAELQEMDGIDSCDVCVDGSEYDDEDK
jgi:hypothetical protein